MRRRLHVCSVLLVSSVIIGSPIRAAMRPAPGIQVPNCYSILSLPCADCPGLRSKYCNPDPAGPFQTCTQSFSSCNEIYHCSQVQTSTGSACDP